MVEPLRRDVWKAIEYPELESERAIDFGVILTKVKCKAFGMDDISMSLGMERKERRVKQPWWEWRPYSGLRMNVHAGERRCGLWVITEVRIVKGFQEEEWGEGSNVTVERSWEGALRKMHWACQLGGLSDFQRHIFSRAMVIEARLRDWVSGEGV